MLPTGLRLTRVTPYNAYTLTYRDAYHQAGMGDELYFAKSRGGAVSQWMRRHHEYDYMESLKLFRVYRAPESDWVAVSTTDDAVGRQVCSIYNSLQAEQKLSLLALGGVDVRYYSMQINKIKHEKIREKAWISFHEHTGNVTDLQEPMLCDIHGVTTREAFTHFPHLFARTLTPLGCAVFLLVLQDYARCLDNHLSRYIIEHWLSIRDYGDTKLNVERQRPSPRIFHRLFQRPIEELGSLPCRIYSGQWGMYWVDTSGYSNKKEKCRVFSLSDAAAQVHHCGPEKGI